MMRRRGAEGLIYTGKRQDTRRWSILPHHTTSATTSPSTSHLLIPPVLIQPRPTTIRPIIDQLDTRPINIAAITIVRPIMD